MKCKICEKYEINNENIGRTGSRTCGTECSRIRNSCRSEKLARIKYMEIHALDFIYDRFNLNQAIPVAPEMLPGDEI